MEQSWEEWPLHILMEMGEDDDFIEQCYNDEHNDELFIKDILHDPPFSSQSLHNPYNSNAVQNNMATTTIVSGVKDSVTGDETIDLDRSGNRHQNSSTPKSYILSFDNSTIIPATPEPILGDGKIMGISCSKTNNSPLSTRKRTLENRNIELKPKGNNYEGGKKNRSDSKTMDHIIAERKRRRELTQKFIALSATIPDLKKTDKVSILQEATNYVKQLQERVSKLEKVNKGSNESIIFLNKIEMFEDENGTSSETSSEDCCRPIIELLPDVEARVFGNEVLIKIHCEKENGIVYEIFDQLQNFHLCVTGSSVLPFGNSTLGITIIAQMCEAYKMSVNDVVKNLRQVLLKNIPCNTDPFYSTLKYL
ncbi:hypothetical protein Lal_00009986 [Lupinus albus]|uniref:Putative transcription factor bHLH family n=1 Tax=Lupinus albus TaxID=3870 RepID=A0A6A5LLD2_LUPAL|nr:putative transcription factor bHLH family [Lupinus albus]KAF1859402.1 hypothetical protein Lal_00009986 [Lupinus albus]